MKKPGNLLDAVVFLLLGAAVGPIIIRCKEVTGADISFALYMVIGILVLCLCVLLHTVIHEVGHMIGGLISGYKFVSFRILGFIWSKDGDRIKRGRLKITGTAGQCLMAPPKLIDGKMPVVLYNLGGILMNLIFSGIFAALCLALEAKPVLWATFAILALVGVALAVINAVPMKNGYNDGSNLMNIRKNPAAEGAFWTQLAVNAYISMGTRLKDMPAVWFAKTEDEDITNPLMCGVAVLRVSRYMDEMRFDDAIAEAERLLRKGSLNPIHTLIMKNELVFANLVSGRTESAERYYTDELKKFMRAMKTNPGILRTEYACALLYENNSQLAAKKKAAFEKAAAKYPYPCEIEGERELMAHAESIAAE